MTDAYKDKIAQCMKPKRWTTVRRILQYIILGIRNGYSTTVMVDKLNAKGIGPLVADKWTVHSLAMQIMFMARLDESSSLGRGFGYLLQTGEASAADFALFQDRIR